MILFYLVCQILLYLEYWISEYFLLFFVLNLPLLHYKLSVTQSCLTLCDPRDRNLPGSSVHGILQARVLECFAIPSSRESSQPRDWTQVFFMSGRFFTVWDTKIWGNLQSLKSSHKDKFIVSWLYIFISREMTCLNILFFHPE